MFMMVVRMMVVMTVRMMMLEVAKLQDLSKSSLSTKEGWYVVCEDVAAAKPFDVASSDRRRACDVVEEAGAGEGIAKKPHVA